LAGLTLDSGALIAHERNQPGRVEAALKLARDRGAIVTVPTVVVAETWRGGPRAARISRLLAACEVEVLSEDLAREAAVLRTRLTPAPSVVDAIVVVSAVRRGDAVLTSDPQDLGALAAVHAATQLTIIDV
jgi:predicted nucleic acid-binding protein